MKTKKIIYPIILFILSIIFLYPRIFYSVNDIYFNSDGYFHFQRFLSVCNSLKDGVFMPYMNYDEMLGFGYPVSLFYPDILYYPFALLTLLNVSSALAFKLFVATTYIASAFSMYIVLNKISKYTDNINIVIALLYAFNYFQYKHFVGGRFAELTASIFIPLVIYGIYIIIKEQKKWWYLVIGMSGLIYSHLLSAVVLFITIILILLINIKKIIKTPYVLWITVKSGLITLLITAKQIFPTLEMMLSDNYVYKNGGFIQFPDFNDMTQKILPNYIPYIFFILVILFILFLDKMDINLKLIFLGILIWLTNTNLFNWDLIKPYFGNIMNVIQMPRRLFVPVISLILIGLIGLYYKECNKKAVKIIKKCFKIFTFVFLFINICIFMYAPGIKDNGDNTYSENIENFENNIYLGCYDYISTSFDLHNITDQTDNFHIKVYELFNEIKNNQNLNIKQQKNEYILDINGNDEYVSVPILYYKGYSAKINNEKLEIKKDGNGLLSIKIPSGNNEISIKYTGTIIQYISIIISFIGILIFISYYIYSIKKKSNTHFSENTNKI